MFASKNLFEQQQENDAFNARKILVEDGQPVPPKPDIEACKISTSLEPMTNEKYPPAFPLAEDLVPFRRSSWAAIHTVHFIGLCPALAEGDCVVNIKDQIEGHFMPSFIAATRHIPQGPHLVRYAKLVPSLPRADGKDPGEPQYVQMAHLRLHVLADPLAVGPFDRVRVVAGQANVGFSGRVILNDEYGLSVYSQDTEETIQVPVRHVNRDFRLGDFVRVVRGPSKDRTGTITGIRCGGWLEVFDQRQDPTVGFLAFPFLIVGSLLSLTQANELFPDHPGLDIAYENLVRFTHLCNSTN